MDSKNLNWESLKYLELAKIAEIKEQFKGKDYIIRQEETIGYYRYDLIIENVNTGEVLVFEVKSYLKTDEERKQLIKKKEEILKKYNNVKFELIIVRPEEKTEINLEQISIVLFRLIENNYISELKEVLDIFKLHVVTDPTITKLNLNIDSTNLFVQGYAYCSVIFLNDEKPGLKMLTVSDYIYFDFMLQIKAGKILEQSIKFDLDEFKVEGQ